MRREILLRLDPSELDRYARTLGVDPSQAPSVEAKVELIESRRGRVADIDAMGMTLHVPIKKLHDKRVIDRLNGQGMSDEDFESLMRGILGDGQYDAVCEHCTDEDGTVDLDAVSLVLGDAIGSDELKNF